MLNEQTEHLGDLFKSSRQKGEEGLPLLSVTLNDGLVVRDQLDRRTETSLSSKDHLMVKKGYIAYNMMRVWQGALGRATTDGLVSPAYVVLRPTKKIDSLYAEYLFKTSRLIYLFWAYSYGLTKDRLRLYYNDFSRISVRIPKIETQKKIAQILSTWDKAINTTEQLLANSQQQKKALMQQLLTGKKRLLDENGVRFSGEWEQKPLGKLGEVVGGLTYSPADVTDEEGTLVLRSSNIQNGSLSFNDNVYVTCTVPEKNITRENDILLCVRNGSKALIGKSALLRGKGINCFHGAFMSIFRAKEPLFIFQLFQSNLFYKEVQKNLGATINSINGSDLRKFKFLIPGSKEERDKIAAVLSSSDQEVSALIHKLDTLKQEKKALMQQLLTGKRRVIV
ncbi:MULTISPECIES: restriction endonuclease subunit S [unclassified Ketobacter]|uniref:restriction endonuclease subunit S n=1 Tax=unclassified Ketobacter TaxID=2639109 RepID=UPI000F0D2231|nr:MULTISPECIES: restriction endonuclease subunit S [unclassified Ketobacter]RLT91615.1 MAG: restriction endonuclease subunit S [Ketobacter sp. GenoA1]RLT96105.1 MAG: restriction endonuclease subunit S [Ketobacter sp.]